MILLKSRDEIEHMRAASVIVAEILAELAGRVQPGVSTAELDALAEEMTRSRGAQPAFKGYVVAGRSFPASRWCTASRRRGASCRAGTSWGSTSGSATGAISGMRP
jgi:methionyl aminopeptidase